MSGELARATFEESLAIGERTRMRFYDAETLRQPRAARGRPGRPRAGLQAALDLARSQDAAISSCASPTTSIARPATTAPLRAAVAKFPDVGVVRALDLARELVAPGAEPRS